MCRQIGGSRAIKDIIKGYISLYKEGSSPIVI